MSMFVDTVKAIVKAIASASPKCPTEVKVFSYKEDEDFCALWGLDNNSKDSITKRLKSWAIKYKNKELTVVIVWDGMPTGQGDTLNVSGFVSPHDWAMVASWLIYKNSCLQDMKLRVLILNVEPSASSFASRSLFAFQNALPWIQDYRVVGSWSMANLIFDAVKAEEADIHVDEENLLSWLRQTFLPKNRDLEMFVKDLLNPSRVLTTYFDDDHKYHVKLTHELWKHNLLKAETRHSVANLVAPAILAFGLPNAFNQEALGKISQGSRLRRALISTLKEIGFLEMNSQNPQANQPNNGLLMRCNPGSLGDIFGRRENIQFVLLDDQFDLGYDHVLAYTLFGESEQNCWNGNTADRKTYDWNTNMRTGSLACHKNIDWLIGRLNDLSSPICDWKQPQYLFEGECDVLFLDLRLWEDENQELRSTEIQKIRCVAEQLLGNTPASDVSTSFEQAFEAAQEACDNLDEFPLKALTLLPLLLSHIDRTLPIVLFTSSHQRVVSEMLQDFPNIITSFAKPLISGYGEAISPADSVKDLEDAIKKAIALYEARIAWKRICNITLTNACFKYIEGRVIRCRTVTFNGRETELRPRLAELFETCVFGNSIYESISLPWELLEYEIARCINGEYDRIITIGNRGEVAEALKLTRNAKTHGNLDRDSFGDIKARWVAVLQLLFLLDFLEGHMRNGCDRLDLSTNSPTTRGPEYVLWSLANTVIHPCDRQSLYEETEQAMRVLLQKYCLLSP